MAIFSQNRYGEDRGLIETMQPLSKVAALQDGNERAEKKTATQVDSALIITLEQRH